MKQAIVVNNALKLPKGKLAAQVAHAAVGAFLEADEPAQTAWLEEGMPKVVLKVETEEDLLHLQARAEGFGARGGRFHPTSSTCKRGRRRLVYRIV